MMFREVETTSRAKEKISESKEESDQRAETNAGIDAPFMLAY